MRSLKILFVLSAVILLAGTVICANSIGVSAASGKLDLQAPNPSILAADGGRPVPWLTADGGRPVPWLTADGGRPVPWLTADGGRPVPWRGIAS